jgi:N-acylglucosamine 2-epimerase
MRNERERAEMKEPMFVERRRFLGAAIAAGVSGGICASAAPTTEAAAAGGRGDCRTVPDVLGGMSLAALREDCRRRLFEQYLPFWEKGAYDSRRGGFTCELNDDGSPAEDEKFIWYQGRGLWVYSFLSNNFGSDARWLRMATATRDFMVKYMYAKEGKWIEKVRRDGTVVEDVAKNVYGALFAAAGLAQYYAATRNPEDLALAKESIWAAMKAYDDPAYTDTYMTQYTPVEVPSHGVRSQGHSMVLVWGLSQVLSVCEDARLAELQRKHVNLLVGRFWNADYGISNEYLQHDWSRIPEAASHMYAGHSLETQWIVLDEALRTKDRALFDRLAKRIHRLLEMCWDYVFEGWSGDNFFVFRTPRHCPGPNYDVKTMWAQCEAMVACLGVLEYTGEPWAKEWYDRVRAFALKTMPVAEHGVWRQAVDRRGKDVKRIGVSTKRKDNFHQVRMLMLSLLGLDRMVRNKGAVSPFPQ